MIINSINLSLHIVKIKHFLFHYYLLINLGLPNHTISSLSKWICFIYRIILSLLLQSKSTALLHNYNFSAEHTLINLNIYLQLYYVYLPQSTILNVILLI